MSSAGRDGQVLEIAYNCGRGYMTILLPAFLEGQSISKIRKLIKIIETSDTPDEMRKISEYVEAESRSFDARMREAANRAVDARTKAKELQPELDRLIAARERYKQKSDPYKFLTAEIKARREKIGSCKADFRRYETEFRRLKRLKEKTGMIWQEVKRI